MAANDRHFCSQNMLIQGVISNFAAILAALNSSSWKLLYESLNKAYSGPTVIGLVCSLVVGMAVNVRGTRPILPQTIFDK